MDDAFQISKILSVEVPYRARISLEKEILVTSLWNEEQMQLSDSCPPKFVSSQDKVLHQVRLVADNVTPLSVSPPSFFSSKDVHGTLLNMSISPNSLTGVCFDSSLPMFKVLYSDETRVRCVSPPSDLHGAIHTTGDFSTLAWNQEGNRFIYIAEKAQKEREEASIFSTFQFNDYISKSGRSFRKVLSQNGLVGWGEANEKVFEPLICVCEFKSNRTTNFSTYDIGDLLKSHEVANRVHLMQHITPYSPVWIRTNNTDSIAFIGLCPSYLGKSSFQRCGDIFLLTLSKDTGGAAVRCCNVANAKESSEFGVAFEKLQPGSQHLFYFTRQIDGPHENVLELKKISYEDLNAGKNQSTCVVRSEETPSVVDDNVFPGLFNVKFPSSDRCWVSSREDRVNNILLLTSVCRSKRVIVAVDTDRDNCLRRICAKDEALRSGSWELFDVFKMKAGGGLMVAKFSSPENRPALFIAFFDGVIPVATTETNLDGFIYLEWKPLVFQNSSTHEPWGFRQITFERDDLRCNGNKHFYQGFLVGQFLTNENIKMDEGIASKDTSIASYETKSPEQPELVEQEIVASSSCSETYHGMSKKRERASDSLRDEASSPPSKIASKRWPLVVVPHGGPHSSSNLEWLSSGHRLLITQGFCLFFVNYAGSTGYGGQFCRRFNVRMGTIDVEDMMHAVKKVCDEHPINRERLYLIGASYGGYVSLKMIDKMPSMFRAVVLQNPLIYPHSLFDLTDVPDYIAYQCTGKVNIAQIGTDERAEMGRCSPLTVGEDTPPILLAVGEEDHRVPWHYSSFVRLLLSRSVPGRVLVYTGADHSFRTKTSGARNSALKADLATEVLRWFAESDPDIVNLPAKGYYRVSSCLTGGPHQDQEPIEFEDFQFYENFF